jgi:hypothetical protein
MDRQVRTTFGPSASYAPKLVVIGLPPLERIDLAKQDSYSIMLLNKTPTDPSKKDLYFAWLQDKTRLIACRPNRVKLSDDWTCLALFAPGPAETRLCCALALVPSKMLPKDAPRQEWAHEPSVPKDVFDISSHIDYYQDAPLFTHLSATLLAEIPAADSADSPDADDDISFWA